MIARAGAPPAPAALPADRRLEWGPRGRSPDIGPPDGELHDANARVEAWLRELPAKAVVGWTSRHITLTHPFADGWVDVEVPRMMEAADVNWCWTILPEGESSHDPFSFAATFDGVVEVRRAREDGEAKATAILRSNDGTLSLDYLADGGDDIWDSVCRVISRPLMAALSAQSIRADDSAMSSPVWTPNGISRALERWMTEYLDRGDVRLQWRPELPINPIVDDAIADGSAEKRGEEPTYQLGERLHATGDAFDFLLGLPSDAAADIMRALNEAHGTTD
jgi:hypothetical protein